MAPMFELKLTREGKFVSGRVISTKQIGEGGPVSDPDNGAFLQLKQLTSADIPELKVNFSEDGSFNFPE